jgi:hypothetical protein
MANTTFTGPVISNNGFQGAVDLGASGTLTTATPTAAATAGNFSADNYIAIVGQDGTTYYIPVANAVW